MYTQFFGNYLLQRQIVTNEQLLSAMQRASKSRLKVGTLALHQGYMTTQEIEECLYLQTREDKRFGEIAMERGYLTEDIIRELLNIQGNDYMLLGQILVEDGIITYDDLDRLLFTYRSEYKLYDLEDDIGNRDVIRALIENAFLIAEVKASEHPIKYMELLYNSLIRFIGDDFTPLQPMGVDEYHVTFAVCQKLVAKKEYLTILDMEKEVAVEFANRYANEQFTEFNEYVEAALQDFCNLHNGLYIVNVSNENSDELQLEPPYTITEKILTIPNNCIVLPIQYTFGTVHLICAF